MERLAGTMSELARMLAGVLAENLGSPGDQFTKSCSKSTCFLRLNRYPPCPFSPETFGLMPHTDSDFLTILHQDQVGGLQLRKDSKWIAVKPNPDALIVNIGDLFQVYSAWWNRNHFYSLSKQCSQIISNDCNHGSLLPDGGELTVSNCGKAASTCGHFYSSHGPWDHFEE